MLTTAFVFYAGLVIGTFLGILVMGLCIAAASDEWKDGS